MLGWWASQPPYLRTTVGLVPVVAGVVCFVVGEWRWGLGLCAFGAVLVGLSFPKPSEKRGYHD